VEPQREQQGIYGGWSQYCKPQIADFKIEKKIKEKERQDMPNHVKNIIKMEGIVNLPLFSEETDRDTGETVKCFDFNKLIPMPESLRIESGSMTDENIMYYLTERCTIPPELLPDDKKKIVRDKIGTRFEDKGWVMTLFNRVFEKAYKETEGERTKRYEKGKTYVTNYLNYGFTTWYDWSIAKWGTKWNAYDNEQEGEDEIQFSTAWSNPEQVILKLSEMYPDAVIEHWWADEDMGNNSGYRMYQGGKIIDGDYNDFQSSEAYETYIKCWGGTDCLYKDDEGNWRRYNCKECHLCD
jgi:hypothetical protein